MEIMLNQAEGSNTPITTDDVERVISFATELHPKIRGLKVETYNDPDDVLVAFYEGPEKEVDPQLIKINFGYDINDLMVRKKYAVKQVCEKLGITESQLSPRMLKLFIIGHEIGHAYDYRNFLEVFGSVAEANKHWAEKRNKELLDLPIPGLMTLNKMYKDGTLSQYIKTNNLASRLVGMKIDPNNLKQVIERQHAAYKKTTAEVMADGLATDILKRFAKELKLDIGQ